MNEVWFEQKKKKGIFVVLHFDDEKYLCYFNFVTFCFHYLRNKKKIFYQRKRKEKRNKKEA